MIRHKIDMTYIVNSLAYFLLNHRVLYVGLQCVCTLHWMVVLHLSSWTSFRHPRVA